MVSRWHRRCATLGALSPRATFAAQSPVVWSCMRPFFAMPVSAAIEGSTPVQHACVAGVTALGRFSPGAFWHFARGHLFEVLVALVQRFGSDITHVKVALGDLTYPCDVRHTWSDFYLAFLSSRPTVDPGCSLSRLRGDSLLALSTSKGREVAAAASCHTLPRFRPSVLRSTCDRVGALVLLRRRRSALSPATREPANAAELSRAASNVCRRAGLRCELNVALEDLDWRGQLVMALRSHALIGYHGSGLGAASLWLPHGAVVLEFLPPGCWWCAFALGVARSNCSRLAAAQPPHRLLWLLSSTAGTPVANPPGGFLEPASPYFGCANGTAFEQVRDVQRSVGLRILHGPLAAALGASAMDVRGRRQCCPGRAIPVGCQASGMRRGLPAVRSWVLKERQRGRHPKVVLNACGGTAVQIFEAA